MLLIALIQGCAKPNPVVIKPTECLKPYDSPIKLQKWVVGQDWASKENSHTTMQNIYYLINQVQLRDGTIKCYDAQTK